MKHDISRLEEKLRTLDRSLSDLAGRKMSEQFFQIIHRPGWTTVAEFSLVNAMADSLQRQIETVNSHYRQLIEAAGQVGQE